ncbi:MAG: efflux RND transporter permease subunit [Candidatus Bipolaricaulota bacterium]
MLDKLFNRVYSPVRYRAYWVIGFLLILIGLSFVYLFPFPIRSSLLDLLPQNDPLINKYRERQRTINDTQNLTVALSLRDSSGLDKSEREDKLYELAEVISPLLQEIPEIESVKYRSEQMISEDYEFLYSLNERTFDRIDKMEGDLVEFASEFPALNGSTDSQELYGDLVAQYEELEGNGELSEEEMRELLEEVEGRNRLVLAGLDSTDELREWDNRLNGLREDLREVRDSRQEELEGSYLSGDAKTLLVRARPRGAESHDIEFSDKITHAAEKAIEEARASEVFESGNYRITMTGSFVTNSQRNAALRSDMLKTTIVSSLAVMVAFFFALGSLFYSALVAFPLVVAVLLTLSWAKFSVGGFNLLTTFLPALVLGLGIDYGIHLLFRFSEERLEGVPVSKAIRTTIRKKGRGTFIAALTTSAVFTTLIFARSQGLVEMGIITSLGIMISFLVYILLLPSLIVVYQRWRKKRRIVELFDYRSTLKRFVSRAIDFRRPLLLFSIVLSGLAIFGAFQLNFRFSDNNVSTEVESIRVQERIQREFGGSEANIGPSFAFFPDDLEEMKELERNLGRMEQVKSVDSLGDYLPENSERMGSSIVETGKIEELQSTLQNLGGLIENKGARIDRMEALIADLSSAQLSSTLSSRSQVTVELNEVIDQLLDIRKKLREVEDEKLLEEIGSLDRQLAEFKEQTSRTNELLQSEGGIVEALPEEIRSNFLSEEGEFVVIAGVDKSIYESENLNSFVAKVSEFTEDYFGLPLIQYQLEGHIRHDFVISTTLAVLMIGAILYLGVNSLRLSLLAVIPLFIGYLWMLGGMKLLGMNFNFINIIISPLLIGIGVDDGLHLIYRWREEEGEDGGLSSILSAFSHTGLAVVTTSMTTIVVFGSLFIARTPGLRILGGTSLLGIGFAMVLSLTVLPAALYLAFKRNEE